MISLFIIILYSDIYAIVLLSDGHGVIEVLSKGTERPEPRLLFEKMSVRDFRVDFYDHTIPSIKTISVCMCAGMCACLCACVCGCGCVNECMCACVKMSVCEFRVDLILNYPRIKTIRVCVYVCLCARVV